MNKKEKKNEYHVQVFLRIRPFNKKDAPKDIFDVNGMHVNISLPNHGSKRYTFDHIFDMDSTQFDIYHEAISPIVDEVLKGYNCTVFAYGQTGSGKTHTMIGPEAGAAASYTDERNAGIIPRAFEEILESLQRQKADYTIRVSYLEIYNEILNDLLSSDDKPLRIYEDPKVKSAVQIHGLKERTVNNKADIYEILRIGSEKRKMAETLMNQYSSRSHAVFTITVHMKKTTTDVSEMLLKTGKLNLVDLAGSENIQRSGATNQRAREAGNINQSLLTLGRVMKALVDKSPHVPYREAKLTRILQDSLGGKTKTTMIATVSPTLCSAEESQSTLEYACKARSIITSPEINQHLTKNILIKKYMDSINELKKDLLAVRTGEGVYLDQDNYSHMLQECEQHREYVMKAIAQCADFENRFGELRRIHIQLEEVFLVTQEELEEARSAMDATRQELKRLRQDRRISQELIGKYDETQSQFLKHSKAMSIALDNHIKEHNVLRAKMDCFYSAMERNENTTDFLNDEHTKLASQVNTSIKDFESMITGPLDDMRQLHHGYIQQQSGMLNEMYDIAERKKAVIRNMVNRSNAHMKNRQQVIEDKIMARKKVSKQRANELSKLVMEQNAADMEACHKMAASLTLEQETCQLQFSKYKTALAEYSAETERSIQIMHDRVQLEADRATEKLLQLNQHVTVMRAPVQGYAELMQRLQQQTNAIFKEADAMEHSHANVLQSISHVALELKDNEKNKCADPVGQINGSGSVKGLIASELEQITRATDDLSRELASCKVRNEKAIASVLRTVDNSKCDWDKCIDTDGKDLSELRTKAQLDSQGVKDTQNALVNAISGFRTNNELYEEATSGGDDYIQRVETQMAECALVFPKLDGVVHSCIKQIQNPKRAGDTPQRKNHVTYTIPKKVSAKIFDNYNNKSDSFLSVLDEDLETGRNSMDFYDFNDSSNVLIEDNSVVDLTGDDSSILEV